MSQSQSTIVLTGGSSGLGLAAARLLATNPQRCLILPARNAARASAIREALDNPLASIETPLADLASLDDLRRLLDGLAGRRIDAVACVAGLQFGHGQARSADGYETTFAVNQLAHQALVTGLLPQLSAGAPVVFIGSGTHDTRDFWARLFRFRGGRYTSAERLAHGDCGPAGSAAQIGRDLYATSKLCNIATAFALARRIPSTQARFFALDPGLMPGTGLARTAPAAARFAWKYLMRPLLSWLPGVSTAERSAAVLVSLLIDQPFAERSGVYVDWRGAETSASAASVDTQLAADLLDTGTRLTKIGISFSTGA